MQILKYPVTPHIGAAPISESDVILKKEIWRKNWRFIGARAHNISQAQAHPIFVSSKRKGLGTKISYSVSLLILRNTILAI